jgi:ferredoxin
MFFGRGSFNQFFNQNAPGYDLDNFPTRCPECFPRGFDRTVIDTGDSMGCDKCGLVCHEKDNAVSNHRANAAAAANDGLGNYGSPMSDSSASANAVRLEDEEAALALDQLKTYIHAYRGGEPTVDVARIFFIQKVAFNRRAAEAEWIAFLDKFHVEIYYTISVAQRNNNN